ncbi:MAG: UDP-N-acetylglucosamine 2-epimerase (non-hydrolyzing) [Bacteriovoracaceae bacterium]|jgi:UDP-N-acetylglucosamine 2-epimerase|nr:UDP-N-acetylglucosamine 2-epimerase (non-hydrolyzing) [Bacteriovoracaceae bacterium]
MRLEVRRAILALKVLTIIGTRPEIIKLSKIIEAVEDNFEHVLVHTGQNFDYELNEIFFNDLGIRKPDYFLEAAGGSAAKTIAKVIEGVEEVLEKEKPDACLLYGDTNSCLAVIPVKRRQIPIFHMEAGNRCFDQRVPEEINRKIVDHLSDINMVHSEHARRYLMDEGIKAETIIKTGSPMREVLDSFKTQIAESKVLETLKLKSKEFFIVSAHREENVDYETNFSNFLDSLNALAEKYKYPIIVSTHPRTRKKLEQLETGNLNSLINFMKPLGFFDYNRLQKEAYCVVSDSGTITEESFLLNFPAIMIRQAHERPEGMDVGMVAMSGLKRDRVLESIEMMVKDFDKFGGPGHEISDYEATRVSSHVIKVIQSYTDYINRVVWNK